MEAKTWADINKSDVNIAVDVGSANEAVARPMRRSGHSSHAMRYGCPARARQALARFPVGVGRLQPRHRADARMVPQGAVAQRREAGRRAGRTQYLTRLSNRSSLVVGHAALKPAGDERGWEQD